MNHKKIAVIFLAAGLVLTGGIFAATGALADTVGANNAGTGSNDASIGTVAWSNPGNITTSTGSTFSTTTLASPIISNYLKGSNYGFAIPAGATIDGIKVTIRRGSSTSSSITDNVVSLVKGGAVTGDNKASGSVWPNSNTTVIYGSTSDLWGVAWTPADINASNFGVALSVTSNSGTNHTGSVDYMQITVTYTVPPADTTKPVITGTKTPTANGNGWNNTDVAVTFTCADEIGGSGIATDTVASGDTVVTTEGAGQSVPSAGSCIDVAGNVADPITVTGINIDKTAPTVMITTPAEGDAFLQFSSTSADWSVSDALSGIDGGLTSATAPDGSAIGTSIVGAYTFMVSATDMAGNTTTITNNYSVYTYLFGGFQAPVSISAKEFKKTSTIPVKFQIFNSVTGLPLQGPAATLWVNGLAAQASGNSNTANWFRYDPVAQQYIFNLSTKSLSLGINWLQISFATNPPLDPAPFNITIK